MTELKDKQFNRFHISAKDMYECLSYIAQIEKNDFITVKRGMLTASIISYARPFSNNRTHERALATPAVSVKKLCGEELFELHERLLLIRNKAVAHSDFEWNAAFLVKPTQNGFITSGLFFDPIEENIELEKFEKLANTLHNYFRDQLREIAGKL